MWIIESEVEYTGCPCETNGPCCANPEREYGHDLFCGCDDLYCDYNWYTRCGNCGAGCGCEV